jgi:hypothetical protein
MRRVKTGDWISRQREQCPSHKWFIIRVFGVFRGLNCRFQPSLSVSISVRSPRCRAVAAGPWLIPALTAVFWIRCIDASSW